MMRVWRWLLLTACTGMGGCVTIAAHYIETPGHHGPSSKSVNFIESYPPHYHQLDFHTRAGLRVAYWYGTPQALDITDTVSATPTAFSVTFSWKPPKEPRQQPSTRGSIVLLHSWGLNATQMLYWGLYFTNAGYVVVMPALRGQGDSGNAPVGYGPREAGDIGQLIHHLQEQHKLPPPLYLLGYSYGASVALFTAPQLPHLRGVIAMTPYVHPAAVIERAPRTGLFTPQWWPHFMPPDILQDVFSPRVMREAIKRADHKLDINLATIDPGNALAVSHTCTLLLRGDRDELTTSQAMKGLASRSQRAQFARVPGANHMTLFVRTDQLFNPVLDWMQGIAADDTVPCPGFHLSTTPAGHTDTSTTPDL